MNIRVPIQIGFPQLHKSGSESHFHIMRRWLKNCDQNHKKLKCRPQTGFLPTRLIDVGHKGSNTICLYETKKTDSLEYIALSHPWGHKEPFFCTFRRNFDEHKKGINIANLTQNFRHAVITTRELGIQYLWIDSICIIQGADGDFENESKHMESVFSSAYCVLAASSATGQSDGFLKRRDGEDRSYVTFKREGEASFYISRFVDDFDQHVLKSPLSKRGWVMQERVLSHRTIYFTDKQTYWQCGEAVRCETLTRMEK